MFAFRMVEEFSGDTVDDDCDSDYYECSIIEVRELYKHKSR